MKIAVIIQARMGSTRLSGKVMKQLCGKTVLAHDIERVRQSKKIDTIVIATTTHESDDVIEQEAIRCNAEVFRGSEENVLSRYYFAAEKTAADIIIRITSDCPLIDPFLMDQVIEFYQNNQFDIVTNAGLDLSKRTFPRGLDVEIFSFEQLKMAYEKADKPYQKEHVTPYIYENGVTGNYLNSADFSEFRWTLDTEEDWNLISKLYEELYHGKHNFYFKETLDVMLAHPEWKAINGHIEQKKVI